MLFWFIAACLTSAEEYAALEDKLKDKDGDGFLGRDDCDDTADAVHPDAAELPGDGIDNDCDPSTSDDLPAVQPLTGEIRASDLDHDYGEGAYYGLGATLLLRDLGGDGAVEVLAGAPRDRTAGASAGAIHRYEGPWTGSAADSALLGDAAASGLYEVGRAFDALTAGPDTWLGLGVGQGDSGGALLFAAPDSFGAPLPDNVHGEVVGGAGFPSQVVAWNAARDVFAVSDPAGGGAVYAVEPAAGSQDLEDAGHLVLAGTLGDEAVGHALAAADLDSDGRDDLLIGAPDAATGTGHIYVARDLGTGDYGLDLWIGASGSSLGQALGAGDVNGDGHIDFAATDGAGQVYLVFGPSGGGDIGDADHVISASGVRSLSLRSDLDLDGDADVALGRPEDGANVLVYYSLDAALVAEEDADLVITAGTEADRIGSALAGGADVDGDGDQDLVIGADEALGPNARGGAIYLLPGGGD